MKRTDPQSLADVIRLTIEENRMQGRMLECSAIELWPQIVGPDIAAQTARPEVTAGKMTVRIPNPALRHELSMSRSSLMRIINSRLGAEVITEIRFCN